MNLKGNCPRYPTLFFLIGNILYDLCFFFKISKVFDKKCACIYSCNCKGPANAHAEFMSHLYKLVYDTFTYFEEFLTDRYSHLYQSSNEHDQDMLQEKLDHLLDHQEPKSMRENEQQALMEITQAQFT